MQETLRLLVAVAVMGLLARTVQPAWRHRFLAIQIWRGIRPGHVLGSMALLTLVLAVAVVLLRTVPFTRLGLGTPLALQGNAVFAPVVEVSAHGGLGSPVITGVVLCFLALLVVLFPWLAYIEELTFREGVEDLSLGRELLRALRFGLVHLIMLIPLAAALAIGVAGFVYGRVYRRAFIRAAARPEVIELRDEQIVTPPSRATARAEAVLAASRLHTMFNTLIVVLVAVGLLAGGGL